MIRTKPTVSVSRTNRQLMGRKLVDDAVEYGDRVLGPRYAAILEAKATELINQRTERREGERHKANTTHLEESMQGFHRRHGNRIEVGLTIKSGANAKKVAALEYGADHDYEISPSGIVGGFGGRSISRSRGVKLLSAGLSVRNNEWLRWENEAGQERFARSVIHKAFEGRHFMRDALRHVVSVIRSESR